MVCNRNSAALEANIGDPNVNGKRRAGEMNRRADLESQLVGKTSQR